MKLEQAEKLLVTNLIENSKRQKKIDLDLNCVVKVERLTGDASTRRYYRVFDDQKSLIACLDNPFDSFETNDFLSIQKIFKENEISVPQIYDYSPSNGYMLEEDLGDCTLLLKLADVKSLSSELELYEVVVNDLIKIHNIKIEDHSQAIFTQRSFDYNKFLSELQFSYKFLFQKFLGTTFSNPEELLLFSFFEKISTLLSQGKKVVCHRDFHSRNIMIKDEKHYIIDFQDSMLGTHQYDLVSLLEDCYYQVSPNNKKQLIKYYWNLSQQFSNTSQSLEQFQYEYNLMAIQRTFKALGSFAYIYYLRNDIRYLKYIGFGFEKLRSLLTLFDGFSEIKCLISKSYYES